MDDIFEELLEEWHFHLASFKLLQKKEILQKTAAFEILFFFVFKYPKQNLTCASQDSRTSRVGDKYLPHPSASPPISLQMIFRQVVFPPVEEQPIVCHLSKTTFLLGDSQRTGHI